MGPDIATALTLRSLAGSVLVRGRPKAAQHCVGYQEGSGEMEMVTQPGKELPGTGKVLFFPSLEVSASVVPTVILWLV